APVAWFGTRRGAGTPPAGSRRDLPVLTLGLQADLTGPGKATGRAHERGMRLAVDRHNAGKDAAFRLALRVADDGGDRARAARTVKELAADPTVLALAGPTWEAAVPDLAETCTTAGLTLLLVSVNGLEEAQFRRWRTLCPTRPSWDHIVNPVIHYLTNVRPSRRTAVVEDAVQDAAGGDEGWRISRELQQSPPAGGSVSVHRIPAGGSDFAGAVRDLTAAGADAVVYAGISPQRAGLLARALADAGFQGPRAGIQPIMEPEFLAAAGPAAEGWEIGAFFTDPTAVPAAAGFVSAYRAAYGEVPARWAVEAYDGVGLLAACLTGLGEDARDRAGLARRFPRQTHEGLAKPLAFDADTHDLTGTRVSHLYRVESGAYRYLGLYPDVT
ncbi:branched-chain amino acid ABC transporter substrate-binding protein, partial [Streptomyces sp. NPDC059233]